MNYMIQRLLSGTKGEANAIWEDDTASYDECDVIFMLKKLREENENQVYRAVILYEESSDGSSSTTRGSV